jgi:hypothetical protein
MWRHVAIVRTDVLEENITSIIRVKRISKLGTKFAVTSNWSTLQHIPLKCRFLHEPHTIPSQKTAFFKGKPVPGLKRQAWWSTGSMQAMLLSILAISEEGPVSLSGCFTFWHKSPWCTWDEILCKLTSCSRCEQNYPIPLPAFQPSTPDPNPFIVLYSYLQLI